MAPFDKIVQKAAENLLGDERLRSNLTDEEAKISLDWALERIRTQVSTARDEASARSVAQKQLARVRPVLLAINALGKKPGTPGLAGALAALEPSLVAGQPLSRAETIALLTTLADRLWQIRATPPTE